VHTYNNLFNPTAANTRLRINGTFGFDHWGDQVMGDVRPMMILMGALFASLNLLATIVAAQDIIIGQRSSLHSKVLDEDRPYMVYLPASYEAKAGAARSYPVLYLLDGGAHFVASAGVIHHLSSSASAVLRMPESIIIGLPNTKRTRDLTPSHTTGGLYSDNSGGSDTFLRFMKEELFPTIESRYRASTERTLVGHSLGGLFALNAFLNEPELFRSYIAIDPSLWWDDQLLVRRITQQRSVRNLRSPISVFIAHATQHSSVNADTKFQALHDSSIQQFCDMLEHRENAQLRVQCSSFAGETHLSVPLVAIYSGLLFVHDGYQNNLSTLGP